ncbi:MAG TPA: hypothetical protein VIX86_12290 [Streptosporangiaceae bacterium]
MTTDLPETPSEQPAADARTAAASTVDDDLFPAGGALTADSEEEALTSLLALGNAADAQMAAMERTMEEFQAIFYGEDVTRSARLLRRNLSPEKRAELARLITEP